jgi:hypothetical protein
MNERERNYAEMSVPEDDELTPAQLRFIAAAPSAPSWEAACRAAGVDVSTGRRWKKLPKIAKALREVKRDAVDRAMTDLRNRLAPMACDTLAEIMRSKKAPATARVSASRTVLDALVASDQRLEHECNDVCSEAEFARITGEKEDARKRIRFALSEIEEGEHETA